MMIYHFNLGIDQGAGIAADFDLPQEKLWEAQSQDDWAQLYKKTDRTSYTKVTAHMVKR